MKKVMRLQEAVKQIEDGMTVAIGGNVLHRSPSALIREIVRQQKRHLKVIKTAGGHDVDLLCAGGCVESVDAGFVSYETEYGLAPFYRKAVEEGKVKANEHACYTVMCALRAAKSGIPFMPVKGMMAGDLLKQNDYFQVINDPFTNDAITVVRAINPDVAMIHVHECDEKGNAVIYGPKYDDELLSLSAKKVIITTEKIVVGSKFKFNPESVTIPYFLVSAVVVIPKGAAPCSCSKMYDIDRSSIKEFLGIQNKEMLEKYLQKYEQRDRQSKNGVRYGEY